MALTPEQALGWVDRLSDDLSKRRSSIARWNDYFRGDQPLQFASNEWRKHHQDRYRGFSDNWCGVVGNAPNERLRVIGFRLDDDGNMSTLEKQFQSDWLRNDMDAQSSAGFLQSIIAKRSFVLVWGDADGNPEYTWEHPSEVIVAYDPEHPRKRVAALKMWDDDDTEYATLYTADELWKYSRKAATTSGLYLPRGASRWTEAGGWMPRDVPGESWPLPHDLGRVPIVEFPNRPMLDGNPMSDIDGAMAMQDAINLLWAYLFGAADYASMPARVIMGQAPPKLPILDDQGNKIGERDIPAEDLRNGRLLWLTGQKTSISQWDAAKLDVFTEVIEVAVAHLAAQTRTPAHYLINTGSAANAPAQDSIMAESGMVKKVEEFQLFSNSPLREVHYLGAKVRNDQQAADLALTGIPLWKNAAMNTHSQLSDSLTKARQMGFPFAWIAEQYGLSQPEVARVLAMREAETDAGLTAAIADVFRVDTGAAEVA